MKFPLVSLAKRSKLVFDDIAEVVHRLLLNEHTGTKHAGRIMFKRINLFLNPREHNGHESTHTIRVHCNFGVVITITADWRIKGKAHQIYKMYYVLLQ